MSSAAVGQAIGASVRRASARRWIESPSFDLLFLILPPLLFLPVAIAAEHRVYRMMIVGILLAFPHYFSSLAFYLWDERRDYYRQRWVAFYLGPLILGTIFFALVYLRVPLIVQIALFFWNTFHVARQNCGLLSIYRHGTGVTSPLDRNAANFAIISVSTALALVNISTHEQVWPVVNFLPNLAILVWTTAGVISLIALGRLALSIVARVREGNGPSLPESAFLVSSLVMFHPYVWMRDSSSATFAMLLPHYTQYLAFVWLVHRRKFVRTSGSWPQQLLSKVSTNLVYLVPVLFMIGMAFWAAMSVAHRIGMVPHYEALYLFIAFEHFYMDGLFWAFREPEIRSSLGPYLMRRSSSAAAAA